MRKVTLVLSMTTAAFAMSTAWLAYQLHEQDRQWLAAGAPMAAAPGGPGNPGDPSSDPTRGAKTDIGARTGLASTGDAAASSASGPSTAGQATMASAPMAAEAADPTTMYARQFLARFDDSAQRPNLVEEARVLVRQQYARLKERLGLSDTRYEQLVSLLAEQQVKAQERWARCSVTAGCDPNNIPGPALEDPRDQFLALLGDAGLQTFDQYRTALSERDSVGQLRARLDDGQLLPQPQAEQLIAALAEERERYSREAAARGQRLRGWGMNLGMIMYPEDANTFEAQVAEATAYSQRLRARAAPLLTPAQMQAYVQMQEELLAQMALWLRQSQQKSAAPQKLASR